MAVRKPNIKNYRQYYKEYYGIEFDSEMAIHHIDGNRNNNDISNLLLMPRELHARWHFHKSGADLKNFLSMEIYNTYSQNSMACLLQCKKELNYWIEYKQELNYKIHCKEVC